MSTAPATPPRWRSPPSPSTYGDGTRSQRDESARKSGKRAKSAPHVTIQQPPTTEHRSYLAKRSAEHTSEPQPLMRFSYAVLCLNKNNQDLISTPPHNITYTHSTPHKQFLT